ncbi:MAG: HDOD domain-containing protein [Gammaproteobacteria bacterium]|nr:HDOD domain-containing protein [Gammaproteobacteria bacterium]
MQHGLAQWLAYLSVKELPILQRSRADVQALIKQAQLSITQYSAPIVYDAGFSARIFRHVNTQRRSSGKHPLTTMGNVLSHLGQTAFTDFLDKTPSLEDLKLSERNNQGYIRVMGQACHASLQARNWALQRNAVETEETQLATLLQNITELMLWCYGDDVMLKIEELCYVKKKTYEQAASTVLGCGMRELGSKLAIEWNLPEMAVDGLLSKQDNFTLASGVSLASELARIVTLNWYGKDAEDMIRRIAKYKGLAEGEIERRLHLNAVDVNNELLDKGFEAPAKLLFQLADDNYKYPQFVFNKENESLKKPAKAESAKSETVKVSGETGLQADKKQANEKQVKAKTQVSPSNNSRDSILEKIKARKLVEKLREENQASDNSEKQVADVVRKKIPDKQETRLDENEKKSASVSKELAAAIREFQLMVDQGKPAHDLIEFAVKTCLLCGVQRSVFVVKVPDKNLLVSRYIAQVSDDIAIKSLKIATNKPNLFSLLMEKSRNIFLNDSNQGKFWKSLPDAVKLSLRVKQFFAMSIFANSHAMGLMYADKVKGELSQAEYIQFQGICRLLSKGIIQSAINKKKANKCKLN